MEIGIEKIRTGLSFLQVVKSPEGLARYVYGPNKSVESTDKYQIALSLAENPIIRLTVALALSSAPHELSSREREGILLFTGLVTHADDVLDGNTIFSGENELRSAILNHSFQMGSKSIALNHLLDTTFTHFPQDKQKIITDFVDHMITIHVNGIHRGKAGEYGYQDALEYKQQTNSAYMAIALRLVDASPSQVEKMSPLILVGQLLDDSTDFWTDARAEVKNLYLGKARDVWVNNNCPANQDLGFICLVITEASFVPLRTKQTMRLPALHDTRQAYKEEFDSALRAVDNIALKKLLQIYGNHQL